MNIDLTKLKSNMVDNIEIDETYKFSKEELANTELIDIKDLKIKGNIYKNSIDEIILELKVTGIFVLPCALTLKPVDYDFSLNIEENIEKTSEKSVESYKKYENTLDILPIIWENILMEIPMRVVSKDADISKLSGDGWKVITKEEKKINPELEKLKDLL